MWRDDTVTLNIYSIGGSIKSAEFSPLPLYFCCLLSEAKLFSFASALALSGTVFIYMFLSESHEREIYLEIQLVNILLFIVQLFY